MLTVGLTGGIGSGKSTVAAQLRELGAVVVDADVVAREVMEPGTPTLAAVAARFGESLLGPDGALDRAGLAAIVFPDPAALADLDAITSPAITARVAQLRAAAPPEAVTVFDMPLLVERRLWPQEHLSVVVGAPEDIRVQRLVDHRGLTETDARHRISAQATDEDRRAAADVWVDNGGDRATTGRQVVALWHDRVAPYNANLLTGTRSHRPEAGAVVPPDPTWPAQAARLIARLEDVLGERAVAVEHIGSTSVPGLIAKDVIDLQVGVRSLSQADDPAFLCDLRERGFLEIGGSTQDHPHPSDSDPSGWRKKFHASMDPGRLANVHIREIGSPGWEFALAFRDWLRAVPAERDAYAAEKRRLLDVAVTTTEYTAAKEPWFGAAYPRVMAWAHRG